MKTIFITIFQGIEAKNILRTSVVKRLLERADVRVVLFVRTRDRADYYARQFSHPRIIFETADFEPQGFADKLFSRLKFQLLHTATTDLRRRMDRPASANRISYYSGLFINRVLARPFFRRLARWLDFRLVRDRRFASFFEKHQPSVVFLAHLFDDSEISLLREAKHRGVASVGFVNSWDKLTARCIIRLLPDTLLVYNDIVKEEARTHADMPSERINVVGIPQYDLYRGYRPSQRARFLARIGLDPTKRFFLYAPMGSTFSDADWDVIDLLHVWVEKGLLPPDVDFLVRFQPNDFFDEAELAKRPWLIFDRPGKRFSVERGVDWDMDETEIKHLADTLTHMSLLVCYASSISVDAAIFDKPVINIDFEIRPAERMIKSPTQFYQMTHYMNALKTGGIRRVKSPDELLRWLLRYLHDQHQDHEGRSRLTREQCPRLDGKAGERIAHAILHHCL